MKKKCKECGRQKPTGMFYRHPNTRDGLFGNCKACVILAARARYSGNRRKLLELERIKAKQRGGP